VKATAAASRTGGIEASDSPISSKE